MTDAPESPSNVIPLRPTQILRGEHRQIDEQLDVLSAALRRLGDRGPEAEVLDRIESVARYIDSEMAVHHRKEEDCLFPFLEEFLASENLRLDARIADHEDLNIMTGKFKEALHECRELEGGRRAAFSAQMLRGYGLYIVHLVREHLLKEDQILFLVADEYLTEEQEAQVLSRFAAVERAAQRLTG
jgi:hemerythrin-like domain-containing protein